MTEISSVTKVSCAGLSWYARLHVCSELGSKSKDCAPIEAFPRLARRAQPVALARMVETLHPSLSSIGHGVVEHNVSICAFRRRAQLCGGLAVAVAFGFSGPRRQCGPGVHGASARRHRAAYGQVRRA